ncbi:MAG: hypothetical protein A2Z97_01600 [Bdellovibrionales bacterium GWB1_52_6]|nr:MAG: hypothetical protein A2Z97_01600 [Bdellovibrionales bacterium GWB1_52_6]OFZ05034.1 MAG: hypothetical protein A2X97_00360 [Bdellovibrionales bacterium GWA1_52_35]HCM41267.1 M23 family peptidase [Bdellovibrionales bacterium]
MMVKNQLVQISNSFGFARNWICFLLLALSACSVTAVKALSVPPETELKVQLSAEEVTDGSLVFLNLALSPELEQIVRADSAAVIRGKFQETEFTFFSYNDKNFLKYGAVLGVPYANKPGQYPIEIKVVASGGEYTREIPLRVVAGNWASEKLKVNSRHIRPTKKDMARIKRDKIEVGKIYNKLTQKKFWDGPFQFPVKSHVTSVFGTKRVFNGEFASFHTGLDFKAPNGTKVYAPSAGVVVLAKSLFFTGNTVMIDHGYGLVTLYAHLSKIKVKPDQTVKAGQLLGLSGMTGRVSGPHLHWQVIVNKTKVNPMGLIEILR